MYTLAAPSYYVLTRLTQCISGCVPPLTCIDALRFGFVARDHRRFLGSRLARCLGTHISMRRLEGMHRIRMVFERMRNLTNI